MKYLLDTHAFLWLDAEPEKLSKPVKDIFQDESNTFYLSLVSVWEMQIKIQLGTLSLNSSLAELIASNEAANRVQLLTITLEHILALSSLADRHRDPFDRMLIAQAKTDNLALIMNDAKIVEYKVEFVW